MNIQKALLITVLWALMLVPFLCQAGTLVHVCTTCPDVPCEHEAECSSDPCNNILSPLLSLHDEFSPPLAAPIQGDLSLPDDDHVAPATACLLRTPCLFTSGTPVEVELPLIC